MWVQHVHPTLSGCTAKYCCTGCKFTAQTLLFLPSLSYKQGDLGRIVWVAYLRAKKGDTRAVAGVNSVVAITIVRLVTSTLIATGEQTDRLVFVAGLIHSRNVLCTCWEERPSRWRMYRIVLDVTPNSEVPSINPFISPSNKTSYWASHCTSMYLISLNKTLWYVPLCASRCLQTLSGLWHQVPPIPPWTPQVALECHLTLGQMAKPETPHQIPPL